MTRRVVETVRFEPANALALPYADDEFDAATVGFGARNFSDLERGLREMARVVRPGGHVVMLEITTPQRPPLSTFLSSGSTASCRRSGALAGDAEAYSYLPTRSAAFPRPEELAAVMWECGLRSVRYVLTAGGIIALHVGEVRAMSAVQAVQASSRPAVRRAARLMDRLEARLAVLAPATARCWPATPATRSPPAASACGRCWCASPRAPRRPRPTRCCAPRSPSSSCTRHARPRRRARRLAAAPWPADGGRLRRTPAGHGDRRPAVLARVRRARREPVGRGGADPVARQLGARRRGADAARRRLAARSAIERYLERCRLKTAVLFRAACELGALEGDGPVPALGAVRRADRARLPAARRRPRRLGPARAHRQAARRRPARRHGHAAADYRARARSAAGRA